MTDDTAPQTSAFDAADTVSATPKPDQSETGADAVEACPFCQIATGRAPAKLHTVTGSVVIFEPLNPVTPGHLLVVPTRHVEDFAESPATSALTMDEAAQFARSHALYDQANVITSRGSAATQTVKHLHVHLIPRCPGDGLPLPWTNQHLLADPADRDDPVLPARREVLLGQLTDARAEVAAYRDALKPAFEYVAGKQYTTVLGPIEGERHWVGLLVRDVGIAEARAERAEAEVARLGRMLANAHDSDKAIAQLARDQARHELADQRRENAELRATVDRVRALADEYGALEDDDEDVCDLPWRFVRDLRAALDGGEQS